MAAENTPGSSNRIIAETKFKGGINLKSDFRIDGEVEGILQTSDRLVVGRTGVINDTVICENADIEGKVADTIRISSVLSLKSTVVVEGGAYADELSIEPGAIFNVTCTMKGDRNFINEKQQNANEKPPKQADILLISRTTNGCYYSCL